MKKKYLTILICLIMGTAVFATTISELEQNVIDSSDSITTAALNKKATLLAIEKAEAEASTGFSGGLSQSGTEYDGSSFTVSPILTITVPGDGDDQDTYQAKGTINLTDPSSSTGTLTYSHTFDFSDSYDSSDIENDINKLQAEKTYNQTVLDIQSRYYTMIESIMTYNNKVYNSSLDLEEAKEDNENSLLLNKYSEDSLLDKQAKAKIAILENTDTNNRNMLKLTIQQFESEFNTTYIEPDSLEIISLQIPQEESATTDIQTDQLKIEKIQAEIDELITEDEGIIAGGNFGLTDDYTLTGGADLSIDSGNWSLTSSFSGDYDWSSSSFTPSVSFGLIYENDTKKEQEETELEELQTELLAAQITLEQDKNDFQYDLASLNNTISSTRYDLIEKQNNVTLCTEVVKQEQTLFEAGISTEDDVEDAQVDLENALWEVEVAKLQFYTIQNQINSILL